MVVERLDLATGHVVTRTACRVLAASTYDAATGQLVLFGGDGDTTLLTIRGCCRRWTSLVAPSRLSGGNRQATAVAVSALAFPVTVVHPLSCLLGRTISPMRSPAGPLAASQHAPLLLTSSGSLDAVRPRKSNGCCRKAARSTYWRDSGAIGGRGQGVAAMGDVPTRIAGTIDTPLLSRLPESWATRRLSSRRVA